MATLTFVCLMSSFLIKNDFLRFYLLKVVSAILPPLTKLVFSKSGK